MMMKFDIEIKKKTEKKKFFYSMSLLAFFHPFHDCYFKLKRYKNPQKH